MYYIHNTAYCKYANGLICRRPHCKTSIGVDPRLVVNAYLSVYVLMDDELIVSVNTFLGVTLRRTNDYISRTLLFFSILYNRTNCIAFQTMFPTFYYILNTSRIFSTFQRCGRSWCIGGHYPGIHRLPLLQVFCQYLRVLYHAFG